MRILQPWARALCVVALAVAVLAPAWGGPDRTGAAATPRDVALKTADRLTIAATFYPAAQPGGPGVVLLPMYKSDRRAWARLIKPLRVRGVSVLAIDPRGHGLSAKQGRKDLGARVAKRDTKIFKAMHKDAVAAVRWLAKDGGCDAEKIVLVGASVGSAVAIDTASRHPKEVAAVVAMSPVAKTLGLDTLAKLKGVPAETPLLLLVHREEVELGADQIVEARPEARLVVYDEACPPEAGQARGWANGTRMFRRLPLVEQTIASFVVAATGSEAENVVLDGIVTAEGPHVDPWAEAVDVGLPGAKGSVRAFRVGRRILFGGTVPPEVGGLRFEVQTGAEAEDGSTDLALGPPQILVVDLGTGSVAWTWGGMGSVPNFPGMGGAPLFGKTVPVLRVVRSSDGTTFEGEWFIPRFGEDCDGIRLFVGFAPTPPPRPRGGMVSGSPQHAVNLPTR